MKTLPNAPQVKPIVVGVSRDCFPIELTRTRMKALARACESQGVDAAFCKIVVENERDAMAALKEASRLGCNTAILYLGNFGPEGPESIFAQKFPGPVMACAAAEESGKNLINGRGDAYCGMLNAAINFSLRNVRVHIPPMPVGLPDELASKIKHFLSVSRVVLGAAGLKIFTFGPRPQDFYACNAPIAQLYQLGVEVMENSELDLLQVFEAVKENDPEVKQTAKAMAAELGAGNTYPKLLPRLARFETALKRFAAANLGSRQYAVFANKCWPGFERAFGFVPCYVNSRLSTQGMPVACEVDIYGAFSEYLGYLAGESPVTLLDINNTVPADLVPDSRQLKGARPVDLFMGFHCGNTPSCCMKGCSMKYQLIMNRLMEKPGKAPDITRGTLEGQIRPGAVSVFRVQGPADGRLVAYISEGHVLDVDPQSFGGIGVFAIPDFARFYRYVLIGKGFPHHAAVAFSHCGKILFDAMAMMGLTDINAPRPGHVLYEGENPF